MVVGDELDQLGIWTLEREPCDPTSLPDLKGSAPKPTGRTRGATGTSAEFQLSIVYNSNTQHVITSTSVIAIKTNSSQNVLALTDVDVVTCTYLSVAVINKLQVCARPCFFLVCCVHFGAEHFKYRIPTGPLLHQACQGALMTGKAAAAHQGSQSPAHPVKPCVRSARGSSETSVNWFGMGERKDAATRRV